jgi:hypothetical protein
MIEDNNGWVVVKIPENTLDLSTPQAIRATIFAIQERMEKAEGAVFGDSDLCPLKHSFAPGVYVREIFIPAGVLIVGKIHKHAHPNFLMSGKVSVLTESGGAETLTGPRSMISPAGTKRVVYAHEDTVWITVHVTEETNLEKIEKEIIAKDYLEYNNFCAGVIA